MTETLDRIAGAFQPQERRGDYTAWGIVESVSGSSAKVKLNTSSIKTNCAIIGNAPRAGERVLVLVKADGKAVVLGSASNIGIDVPIAQGKTGVWNWRKWSSGIGECWFSAPWGWEDIKTAWGSGYKSRTIWLDDTPINFISPTSISGHWFDNSGQGYNAIASCGIGGVDNFNSYFMLAFRPDQAVTQTILSMYVIGRWK